MRAQLVTSSPGVGKTTAVASAIGAVGVSTRIVTGSLMLARELALEHGYSLIEGRNSANCERYDVVHALGEAGHEVERLACGTSENPRCQFRESCLYWRQFRQGGTRVGAAEQLFNKHFLAGGSVVVVDDADLSRVLIDRRFISKEELGWAFQRLRGKRRAAVRAILVTFGHACLELAAEGDGRRLVTAAPAWDLLSKSARLYGHSLVQLVQALPKRITLPEPAANGDGSIDVSAVENVPPGTLRDVLAALQEELPRFLSGEDFNSRLRLGARGIEAWTLRPFARSKFGEPLLASMDLLILDATPVPTLVNLLTKYHERLPDLRFAVRMPENVTVVQYATATNGHAVLREPSKLNAMLAELSSERLAHAMSSDKEGAICFKSVKPAVLAQGLRDELVVTYGNVRGTNALEKVERLHLIGRPMPPGDDLTFLAAVLHHDEPAIDEGILLVPRLFGGQRFQVDVVDYADSRVSELLVAEREQEMVQAIHRARLLSMTTPRLNLGGTEPVTTHRSSLRIVIYTSHPVPGLKVDELITRTESASVNDRRQADADARIRHAIFRLQERCESISTTSLALEAKASRRTVARNLRNGDHTPKRDLLSKGVINVPQPLPASSASPDVTQRAREIEAEPSTVSRCQGGCGKPMPAGQKCFNCATRAVLEWSQAKRKARTR